MRITSLQLKNIGVFEDETIEFQPCPAKNKAEIHIFTGTNGSGKSTILKALAAAFQPTSLTTENTFVSKNDTNNFSKYLRYKSEISCGDIKYELKQQSNSITYTGCSKGIEHLHFSPEKNQGIIEYRNIITQPNVKNSIFDSSYFAYSGYRLLDFSINSNNDEKTSYNKNPLYQSLEFQKKTNPAFSIDNWIKTSLFKRSYAKAEGLNKKEHNYSDIIEKFEKAISEIIGFEIKFKLSSKDIDTPLIEYNGKEHDLDVLPDGLKSIISWLADLCMRLEELNWVDDIPVLDRNIILFLDEIEVHLHIEWQRKILPVIQKLLPNAQIFISTHSPFVVNSVDDAWVYSLAISEDGNAKVRKVELTEDANSISYILRSIFDVTQEFGLAVEKDLKKFYEYRDKAIKLEISEADSKKMLQLGEKLAQQSVELESIVSMELRQIKKQNAKAQKI